MAFSYITEDNIYDLFEKAQDHHELQTSRFPEYFRVARNRPSANIDKKHPPTTDGTTASIIQKSPKRVIQQLPTGKITTSDKNDWRAIVSEFLYTDQILPYANEEYDLIHKCWTTVENGMSCGSQAVYSPFIDHDGVVSPDYTLPYWGDIFMQPGKKSGYSAKYVFMRAWWTPEDVEALIESLKSRKREAKSKGDKFESQWDLSSLKQIKDSITDKDEKAKTPDEAEQSIDAKGVEIVTALQVGEGATFFSFNPATKLIVRREVNPDPRGKMPIDWYYYDLDGNNPYGRGIVDLVYALQNLIDGDMRMYQYNRALMLAPPLVTSGIDKRKVTIAPNAIIDKGNNPNATVETLKLDSSAVTNYPNLYGLQKSQLLNLVSSPDTSISAEVGNPGFGKTPTAIKQQNANISVDDNAIRKGFEAFFENWSETAINLFWAKRRGKEKFVLDDDTADKLRDLEQSGYLPIGFVDDNNAIIIDFDKEKPKLQFRVDASTSKVNSEAAQLEALTLLVNTLDASQSLTAVVPQDKIAEVWNSIAANSAVDGAEKLKINIEELQAQIQAQEEASMAANFADPNAVTGGVPEGEPTAQDDDSALVSQLYEYGVPEDLIAEALDMADKGYSADEIMIALQDVMQEEGSHV